VIYITIFSSFGGKNDAGAGRRNSLMICFASHSQRDALVTPSMSEIALYY
jgi:hypothetical protein